MVVVESLVLHRLKALTKIYSVISLSEIAAKLRLGASAAELIEKKIVHLVMRGEIAAKIDHVSGVVHFAPEDSSVVSDDAVIRQRLHGAMQVGALSWENCGWRFHMYDGFIGYLRFDGQVAEPAEKCSYICRLYIEGQFRFFFQRSAE